jgi:hypothetical protein
MFSPAKHDRGQVQLIAPGSTTDPCMTCREPVIRTPSRRLGYVAAVSAIMCAREPHFICSWNPAPEGCTYINITGYLEPNQC